MTKTSLAGMAVWLSAVCLLAVSGCSDDKPKVPSAAAKSFRSAAEQAIRDDVDATLPGDATAKCDDPSSTEIGSIFSCVATASDGSTYIYSAEIVTEKNVTVNFVELGDSTATGGS